MELHNDIGHGINTYPPSKGVPEMPEFEFNNTVGKETKRLLNGKVNTFEAQPFDSKEVSLIARTNQYNARYARDKTAIGISNHANYNSNPDIRGFGVFYWHTSPEAKKLAEIILDEYKKEFPGYPIWGNGLFESRPNSWTDFHMCRETKGIFVLVEWEFMSNPVAIRLLKSDDYRKRCALVNARAVCRWYGIKFDKKVEIIADIPSQVTVKENYATNNNTQTTPVEKSVYHVVHVNNPEWGIYRKAGANAKDYVQPLSNYRGWHLYADREIIVNHTKFYRLNYKDEILGWTAASQVSSILPVNIEIIEDTLTYYRNTMRPNETSGVIQKGEKVRLLEDHDDKFLVWHNNLAKWISRKYVK